jgi:hypothetical protein
MGDKGFGRTDEAAQTSRCAHTDCQRSAAANGLLCGACQLLIRPGNNHWRAKCVGA